MTEREFINNVFEKLAQQLPRGPRVITPITTVELQNERLKAIEKELGRQEGMLDAAFVDENRINRIALENDLAGVRNQRALELERDLQPLQRDQRLQIETALNNMKVQSAGDLAYNSELGKLRIQQLPLAKELELEKLRRGNELRLDLEKNLYNLRAEQETAAEARRLKNAQELAKQTELGKLQAAKELGKTPILTRIGQGAALAAGLVLGATFIDKVIDAISSQYDKYTMRGYFEKMLEVHPQLQNEDPVLVARYWESLQHFSPHMAKDPLAAGAFITQSIRRVSGDQFGGPPPDTYSMLAQIQKQHKEGKGKKDSLYDITRSEATKQIIGGAYGV